MHAAGAGSAPVTGGDGDGEILGIDPRQRRNIVGDLAAPAVSGDCSRAAARQAVADSHLDDPNVTDPIFKVLCGAFMGSGSQTMAATLFGPGNLGLIGWVVFSWSGTAWTFVMIQH